MVRREKPLFILKTFSEPQKCRLKPLIDRTLSCVSGRMHMSFLLDSALVYEARVARDLGWVRGITTNPILLAQSELPPEETLRALAATTQGEVFYQIMANDLESMLAEAWIASQLLGSKLVLKVPATPVGFQAAARLTGRIPYGVTAVFSPAQAMVAAAAGARYVIPYVNRATRLLGDGLALVCEIAAALGGSTTEILAASIKTVDEAVAAHRAGATHLTLPLAVLEAMSEHELSGMSVAEFASSGVGIQY
jgi:transaldolase